MPAPNRPPSSTWTVDIFSMFPKFLSKIFGTFFQWEYLAKVPLPPHLESGYLHMCENRGRDNNQNDDIRTKEKAGSWMQNLFRFGIVNKIRFQKYLNLEL